MEIENELGSGNTTGIGQNTTKQEKDTVQKFPPYTERKLATDEYGFERNIFSFETGFVFDSASEISFFSKLEIKEGLTISDPSVRVVEKSIPGIANTCLKGEIPIELVDLVSEKLPKASNLYKDIFDGIATCSMYDKEGNVKSQDDGEGWALYYTYIHTYKSHPDMAEKCLKALSDRVRIIYPVDSNPQLINFDSDLKYKGVPIDKLFLVHVTDYHPAVNGSKSSILPLANSTEAPRWTVHTFINGMVEDVRSIGQRFSWEDKGIAICMPFKEILHSKQKPANIFHADTFFATDVGYGLIIPKGSFILVPIEKVLEYSELYKDTNLSIVGYDQAQLNIRDALKQEYKKRDLPFFENIPTTGLCDDGFGSTQEEEKLASVLGIDHYDTHASSSEGLLEEAILYGFGCVRRSRKYLNRGGVLTREEADDIAVTVADRFRAQYKPRKHALYYSLQGARFRLASEIERQKKDTNILKALKACVIAGIV